MKEHGPLIPRSLEPRNPREPEVLDPIVAPEFDPAADVTDTLRDPYTNQSRSPEDFIHALDREAAYSRPSHSYDGLVAKQGRYTHIVLSHEQTSQPDVKLEKEGMPLPGRRTEAKSHRGKIAEKARHLVNVDGPARGFRTLMPTRKETFKPTTYYDETLVIGTLDEYGNVLHVSDINKDDFGKMLTGEGGAGYPKEPAESLWWGETHEMPHERTIGVNVPTDVEKSAFQAIADKQQDEALESLQGLKYSVIRSTVPGTKPKPSYDIEVTNDVSVSLDPGAIDGWKHDRSIAISKVNRSTGHVEHKVMTLSEFKKSLDDLSDVERGRMHARFEVANPPTAPVLTAAEMAEQQQEREMQTDLIEKAALEVMSARPGEETLKIYNQLDAKGGLSPKLRDEHGRALYERFGHLFPKRSYNAITSSAERKHVAEEIKREKIALFLLTSAEHISEDSRAASIESYMGHEEGRRNVQAINELIDAKGLPEVVEMALDLQHSFQESMRELNIDVPASASVLALAVTELAEQQFNNTHVGHAHRSQPGFIFGDPFEDDPTKRLDTIKVKRQMVDKMVGSVFIDSAVKLASRVVPINSMGAKVNSEGQPAAMEAFYGEIQHALTDRLPPIMAEETNSLVEEVADAVQLGRRPGLTNAQSVSLGRKLRSAANRNQ